jgi:predicted aldo/keto reductase-like oxidoreductase
MHGDGAGAGRRVTALPPEAAALLKQKRPADSLASWAIRFVAGLPNVLCVLSGMSDLDMLRDNVQTVSELVPLSDEEQALLAKARDIYLSAETIPCTGCRYCSVCPKGINIPQVIKAYNMYLIGKRRFQFVNVYSKLEDHEKAHHCIGCKKCVRHCPQGIDIPGTLSKIHAYALSEDAVHGIIKPKAAPSAL